MDKSYSVKDYMVLWLTPFAYGFGRQPKKIRDPTLIDRIKRNLTFVNFCLDNPVHLKNESIHLLERG